jgi:hypothetical protein
VTQPSCIQVGLAPAIEYNFSDEVGLIAGSWFTILGRNSYQIVSAIASVTFFLNF